MLKREKFKEIFGFDFSCDEKSIAGPTRNNPMFTQVENRYKEGIVKIKIEQNKQDETKYRFVFYDKNNNNTPHRWNSKKSFGSRLFDIMLLDPIYENLFEEFGNTTSDDIVINYFLGKTIEIKDSFENLTEAKEGKGLIFNYWKRLSKSKNYFTAWVSKRINLITYNCLEGINAIASNNFGNEKKNKGFSKIQLLETIVKSKLKECIKIKDKKNLSIEEKSCVEIYGEGNAHISLTLKQLIASVQKSEIIIPVFQRDYVWNNTKIIPLLNSILKGYPIGSILFGDTEWEFNSKNAILESLMIRKSEKSFVVLDGQQRITTLLMVLSLVELKEKLATNIDEELENLISLSKVEDIFLIENSRGEKEFVSKNGLKDKKNQQNTCPITKKYKEILDLIGDYELSIIFTKKFDTGQLIDIFNNINIGSAKLTNIDLLHSLFYAQNKNFDLLKNLNSIQKDNLLVDFSLTHEVCLQTIKLIYDVENIKEESVKAFPTKQEKEILDINIKKIFDLAKEKKEIKRLMSNSNYSKMIIMGTVKLLDEYFGFSNFKSLPNLAFFHMTTAFILKNNLIKKEGDKKQVKSLVLDKQQQQEFYSITSQIIIRSINKDYSSGTASKINTDLRNYFKNKISEHKMKASLLEEIQNTKYSRKTPLYKIIIGQLALKEPVSLVDGQTRVKALDKKYSAKTNDEHHFIPKKCPFYESTDLYENNSIGNIFLIDYEENRREIKAQSPHKYLLSNLDEKEIIFAHEKLRRIAKTHLVDEDLLINFYENKDKYGKEEIKEILRKILKNREEKISHLLKKL